MISITAVSCSPSSVRATHWSVPNVASEKASDGFQATRHPRFVLIRSIAARVCACGSNSKEAAGSGALSSRSPPCGAGSGAPMRSCCGSHPTPAHAHGLRGYLLCPARASEREPLSIPRLATFLIPLTLIYPLDHNWMKPTRCLSAVTKTCDYGMLCMCLGVIGHT